MARPKKVQGPPLAVSLAQIATTGAEVEKAATGLLTSIRAAGITTLAAFDEAVKAAYDANGWNTRPGKPTEDRRSVPHTVRTYVWEIRSAFRAGVEVQRMKSMYDIRMAKKAIKEANTGAEGTGGLEVASPLTDLPPEVVQDLEGVRVLAPRQPNGALFHDLIACFITLEPEQRSVFGRQLARILHRYQAGAMATLQVHSRANAAGPRAAAG
jgi:hypothetical protein